MELYDPTNGNQLNIYQNSSPISGNTLALNDEGGYIVGGSSTDSFYIDGGVSNFYAKLYMGNSNGIYIDDVIMYFNSYNPTFTTVDNNNPSSNNTVGWIELNNNQGTPSERWYDITYTNTSS